MDPRQKDFDERHPIDKVRVYGTIEGKLYINPEELFSLPKVQELIKKIANGKLENMPKPI